MVAERAFDLAIRLTEKLGSLAYDEISLAWGVKSDLRKLEDTMSTIKGVLLDAEEKQANNKELRSWLRQLKNVFLDAEDVLDEFDCEALRKQVVEKFHGTSRKVRRFFSRSNPIAFRFRVAHEIKELRERLEELKANKSIFDSLTSHSQGYYGDHDSNLKHVLKARETHSFVRASEVVGRGFEKEAIVGRLIEQGDDHVSVIPVVGMGGLGKTTLAKLVYNDTRVIKNFELMIWQYVSIDFDVARLTKEILSSALGTNISGELSMNQLQEKLRDALKDKKFLLVLDDVWNEDAYKWGELKDLLVEGAKLGSKVLVTTRNVSVTSIMGTVPTNINLQNLSKEDCMSLFVKCAFKEGEEREHPNLFEIGKDIVRKCGGVPLAVKTLGCQLYSKTDEREWAMIRDSAIWELEREGVAHVLPALRLSYTHLPSHLRRCLAYCSLLPRTYEDHDSRLLINIWMANGILESHDHGNLELEDVGELYFKELCERSFFQNVQDLSLYCEFDMHDLIHDLVRSVAQDECCAVDFEGTKEISENVRHLSVSGPAQNVPSIFLQTCFSDLDKRNRLRSITVRDIDINESFLQTCFSRFKYLRMLILFESTFEAFPSSIVSLKHMRYLDLSGNESISKLPDAVCKLQSLEILSVNGCANLEELPRDISKLISLRVLHITTKQTSFPDNGVGCMKSLRSLSIVDCGNLTSLPRDMSYLAALHTLMIWDCEQLDLANGSYQLIPLRLRSLRIAGVPKMVALPEWLRGAANTLRVLCISDCENLDALPEWLTSFTSLRILDLRVCPKLVSLPEGMHPLEVKIEDCPQLKRTRSASKGKNDKTAMQAAAKAVPGGAGVEYGDEAGGKLVHFDGPFVFTVDDLLCATAEIMGKSTYGTAYKATLEKGNQVAVKRLREKTAKGQKEFEMEAAAIGKIRHPNLLSLRAYYLGPEEKLLVFDYMPKGSLASFLHAQGPETIIDWPTRMNIVIGITRGLCHLHNEENIVHGNLTSSNILLDEQTNAHIADFGLSRLMTAAANTNVIATAGTLGYNAPELSRAKKATTKTDVYSLGVIILELLTGKSPGEPMNGMDLPQWVASIVKEEWTNEVFDLEIMRDVPTIGDLLLNTLKLALHCVDPLPALRPEAQQVLEQLEEIKVDQPTGGSAEEEGAEVPPPAGSSN